MERGLFITFEGIEGCGKTTQVRRINERLKEYGLFPVMTFEPGGTHVGMEIRRVLLDVGNRNLSPLAELLLYVADRAQHMEEVIEPALAQGRWVLCDRFYDATDAYQGRGRGQEMEFIRLLNEKVTHGIRPDRTFVLDCPVEVGLERALKRNKKAVQAGQDRFEQEALAFHRDVRQAYLDLAREEPERIVLLDARLAADELEERIMECLRPYLRDLGEGRA